MWYKIFPAGAATSTFSPTDLVATALGQCMVTVMGIKAQQWGKDLKECVVEVTKVMSSNPRRISEIELKIIISKVNFTDKEVQILENTAKSCPVAFSLHSELNQKVLFNWID